MIHALFRFAGRLALLVATMMFLAAVSLFVLGAYILTWPVLRLSPRDKKIAALTNFAAAGMQLMTAFTASQIVTLAEDLADGLPGEDDDPES